jgi:hypothetical protein
MKIKVISGLFALCGLASLAVFGASGFIPAIFEPILKISLGHDHANAARVQKGQLAKIVTDAGHARRAGNQTERAMADQRSSLEIPEGMLWHTVFDFTKKIGERGEEANSKGERGSLYFDYFTRQGPLSVERDLFLKQKSRDYFAEIEPIEKNAKAGIEKYKSSMDDSLLPELKTLQSQRDRTSVRFRDQVKEFFGDAAFIEFESFLKTDFSKGATHQSAPTGLGGYFFYDAYSWIIWDETRAPTLITGFSELYFYYFSPPYYWDPYLESYFLNTTTQHVLNEGFDYGLEDIFPAVFSHPTFSSTVGNTYCTLADHYSYFWPNLLAPDGRYDYLDTTYICHTVNAPPTPTPTPNPTPTPCEPLLPCQSPTPTPAPPIVTIAPVDVVEKFGEKTFNVSVFNNAGGVATLKIMTATGTTGDATFPDNSTQLTINGNVTDQQVTINGVLESSQKDNMSIEATVNNSPTVFASRTFTVAVIAEVFFQKFDPDSSAVEPNPGNGEPGSQEGDRVFPDKNSPTDNAVDRALVKVNARILPVGAGFKVYFGSYDLDDPSTNTGPIDPNSTDGNDNNGQVNGSKSGDFTIPPAYACDSHTTGTAPDHVSKVACTTGPEGSATAVFKTTMQPGDNFTVAASLSAEYRDGMVVDNFDGTKLNNRLGLPIHISKLANLDQTAGVRTRMLTVWRRLQLEIDNMSNARENYLRDNVSGAFTISARRSRTITVTATNLDENRFVNGRLVLAWITEAMDIVSNTINTITVRNTSTHDITLANGVNVEVTNSSGLSSAVGTITTGQTIPASQTATLSFSGVDLNNNAFTNGQLYVTPILKTLTVSANTSNTVTVTNPGNATIAVADATHFRLYDDDDFNSDDTSTTLDGDENEPVVRFPDTLRHLSDNRAGGNYPDGTPVNILARAYILPEYNWAENVMHYNDSVPPFDTNIELLDVPRYENIFQGSVFSEQDGFWIGYFLISYQGRSVVDHDGTVSAGGPEGSEEGLTGVISSCDCLNSPTCPRILIGSVCSGIPAGGTISFVYQETLTDQGRDNILLPNWTIPDSEIAAPHELGHQFGLNGDQPGSLFFIMDYPNNNASPPSRVQFHPEHINIMRHRVRSPGR